MSIRALLDRGLVACCGVLLALFVLLLSNGWRAFAAAGDALATFRTFRSALVAMETVSAERAPTNGALGEEWPVPEPKLAALRAARRASDDALALLSARLDDETCEPCRAERPAIDAARSDLLLARANADRLLRLPRAERSQPALDDAVARMVDVIPQLQPAVYAADRSIVTSDAGSSDMTDYLRLASLAALLREQAGLLGSRFTGALGARRPLSGSEQRDIAMSYGRIGQLRELIDSLTRSRTDAKMNDDAVLARMRDQYFGAGLAYAGSVEALASRPDGAPPSTAQFAQRYVPLMRPIVDFRDAMLTRVESGLRRHRDALLVRLAGGGIGLAAVAIALLLGARRFRRRIIVPLADATHEIVAVAAGRPSADIAPHAYSGEIRELFDAVRTLKANTLDRMRSIEYASLIQRAMLPDPSIEAGFGANHFVLWKPRDVVGGDFYLCRRNADGDLVGVIDCAGHGVPGALMTMTARALFERAMEATPLDDPAAILRRTDDGLRRMLSRERLDKVLAGSMDAGLVFVDRVRRRIVFAGAKISLFATDGRDVHEHKGARRAIGDRRRGEYDNVEVALRPGWTFYLGTDGLFDQAGGDDGFGFGGTRFASMLRDHAHLPLDDQARVFEATLDAYRRGHPQRDDMTLLAFRID
ncbi:stage II sporulation protein E [Paraburkholderia caballeronis]|uniref:SpoIIE family protein phosphatase n=1 Tax=Paraburkholderia caballeronis TaxID=416943 RepID=UPI001065C8B6|nr:SpoIIE family protein phosphatase [Paraburkholderia caballeronis]TDV26799.1 stage II sporulation protein E [Paraburkholderia caballeronis]